MRVLPGLQGTYWDNTQEDGGDTGLGSSPQQSAQGSQIKIKIEIQSARVSSCNSYRNLE